MNWPYRTITTIIVLLLALAVGWGVAQAGNPPAQPRTAKPIPAKVVHHRNRLRYLANACAPLDYWHVICPERWHP